MGKIQANNTESRKLDREFNFMFNELRDILMNKGINRAELENYVKQEVDRIFKEVPHTPDSELSTEVLNEIAKQMTTMN